MSLPAMAYFPLPKDRIKLHQDEWEASLDAWTTLIHAHLRLPTKDFISVSAKDPSIQDFFAHYLLDLASPETSKEKSLRRVAFLLAHRLIVEADVPDMLTWKFLSDLSNLYRKSARGLLKILWEQKQSKLMAVLQELKIGLIHELESPVDPNLGGSGLNLSRIPSLVHASPEVGSFLMIGSDLMDALSMAYDKNSKNRKKIVAVTYLCLRSLMGDEKPNLSLLFDHLYTLKSSVSETQPSLIADLVGNTPLLRRLEGYVTGPDSARAKPLIKSLETFRRSDGAKRKKLIRRKIDKGKGRADEEYGHGAFSNIHVHQMSLVTQVQDLFPDLGSGFVVKLLDEYNEDVEQITAHLLENSLTEDLQRADQKAEMYTIIIYFYLSLR